jgi:CHAT domain-containing protein
VQSDRQQFAAAQAFRAVLDVRLSMPGRLGSPPSYRHVLAWKGALLMRQQQRRLFLRIGTKPEVRTAADRLQSATRRLAALTLTPAATRERLQELEKEQEEAQAELARLSADFRAARDQERPSAAAVIDSLPDGAVLIDFLFYVRHGLRGKDGKQAPQRQLLAYVLRRGKPIVRVGLGRADAIEEAVAGWREALLGQRADERERAERVHALIWAPMREELEGAKVVLVSPDGVLGAVPFAALPGREKGTFLTEDVTLAAVPLPRSLPETRGAKDAAVSLLVAGDLRYEPKGVPPRPGGLTLPRLEATGAEADSVAASFRKRYPDGTVTDLREGDATKPAIRKALERVRFAHLATHGYFAPEGLMVAGGARSRREALGWHPLLLAGLALSDAGRGEAGILTALEVSEMDLTRLDLAVLSACETGLGRAAGGEGLLGLQRAFQGAGARSVAASLWKVDDEYTQKLMTRFYAAAWDSEKPVGRAEALRQAQLSLLREGDKGGPSRRLAPIFWAAFVLSGDWR